MRRSGFTLVEMLLVLAILGIIAALAYPSYGSFITKARRSQAQADLMALAAAMNEHRQVNYSFLGAASDGGTVADTGAPSVFSDYSPADGQRADRFYDLVIDQVAANGRSYRLRATPVSTQAGDGDLYYFSDGDKGWDRNDDGSLAAGEMCWDGAGCSN